MNEGISNIEFSELHTLRNINMIPGQVALFYSIDELDLGKHPYCVQAMVTVIGHKGKCIVEINLNRYEVSEKDMLIIIPGQIVQIKNLEPDFKAVFLAASQQLIEKLAYKIENITHFFIKAKESPYWKLNNTEYQNINDFIVFLSSKMKSEVSPYTEGTLRHILLALFYECYGIIENQNLKEDYSRKKELFNKFLDLLSINHRKEHEVQFYSDSLFITSKYLSAVVESVSGKSAKKWIDEYIILEAKVMLKSSTIPIQEIAYTLGFSDISFFGKYFKRITGVSPKKYRINE